MSKKKIISTLFLGVLFAGALDFMRPAGSYAQAARNPQGTLFGENEGDFIILQWDLNDNGNEYIVYRSTSLEWTLANHPADFAIRGQDRWC